MTKGETIIGEEYAISPEFRKLEKMYKTGMLTGHEQPGIVRLKHKASNYFTNQVSPRTAKRDTKTSRHVASKVSLSPRLKQIHEI